jgi:SAM-dependent MidA family methyltransferase
MRIVLIEASPKLRNAQAEKLADHTPAWTERIDDLPRRPLWFVANEFFDALPIRQFRRQGEGWAEVMVALDDPGLRLALAAPLPLPELAHRLADTRDGDIVELCPAARPVAATIGQRIATHGGAALLIDYGGWRSLGDTFQALKAHEPVDPLAEPGLADLTAHVDFEPVALAAAPAVASGLTPQGVFLERLGIAARAEALARRLSGTARDRHLAAYRRLTLPEEMGTLFQILALTPPGASPVPGMNDPRPSAP